MYCWFRLTCVFAVLCFCTVLKASPRLDARFVLALNQLNQKVDPSISLKIKDLGDNHYQITDHDQVVVELKDSDFYTLYQSLELVAYYLLKIDKPEGQLKTTDFSKIDFSPSSLTKTIIDNNVAALTDNNALFKVSKSLIILSFFADDTLDELTELKANAWMTLALYEAKTGERNEALLVMLSSSLGYDLFAEYSSHKIKSNPLYGFYQGIALDNKTTFSKLLQVRRAAIERIPTTWVKAVDSMEDDSVSPSFMLYSVDTVDAYNVRSKLLPLYPLFIVNDYFGSNKIKPKLFHRGKLDLSIDNITDLSSVLMSNVPFKSNLLISEFETLINEKSMLPDTGILSQRVIINYWQSRLFNSYYQIAIYLAQVEPDKKLASSLLSVFQANIKSQVGLMLYSWYQVFVAENSYYKSVNMFTLIADSNTPSIKLLEELYDWQYYLRPSKDKKYEESHEKLLSMLDSRYQYKTLKLRLDAEFGNILESEVNLEGYQYQINHDVILALDYLGKPKLLRKALKLSKLVNQQAQILSLIFKYNGSKEGDLSQLAKLYKDNPNSFFLLKEYVGVLLDYAKEPEAAIKTLNRWLLEKRDLSSKDYLDLISLIAKAKLQVGDVDAAWNTIAPTLKYHYPETTLVAADIALKQQKTLKTNEIIAEYKRSFPYTIESLSYQLKSLLLQKNYHSAADLIQSWYYPISDEKFKQYVIDSISEMDLSKSDLQQFITETREVGLPALRIGMLEKLLTNRDLISGTDS